MEANAGEYIKKYLHLKRFPRISLHCKLVPVQYREYEYGLLVAFVETAKVLLADNTKFIIKHGHPTSISENICSEDDLRSTIFGTVVVKFLACPPVLGFSNIEKKWYNCVF